ncbi:hypothetical protein [Geotalea sp. SG265]|uniref:hypothetical protein n=1 Tax=Geotalea sp. SG265 TaxID=2922867 RepID=UPI001FAEB81E|nr:hypothetical protein [Geotalea sp. SG265]
MPEQSGFLLRSCHRNPELNIRSHAQRHCPVIVKEDRYLFVRNRNGFYPSDLYSLRIPWYQLHCADAVSAGMPQ